MSRQREREAASNLRRQGCSRRHWEGEACPACTWDGEEFAPPALVTVPPPPTPLKDFTVLLATGYTLEMRGGVLQIVGPKRCVEYLVPMTADERQLVGDLLTGKLGG